MQVFLQNFKNTLYLKSWLSLALIYLVSLFIANYLSIGSFLFPLVCSLSFPFLSYFLHFKISLPRWALLSLFFYPMYIYISSSFLFAQNFFESDTSSYFMLIAYLWLLLFVKAALFKIIQTYITTNDGLEKTLLVSIKDVLLQLKGKSGWTLILSALLLALTHTSTYAFMITSALAISFCDLKISKLSITE